MTTNRTSILFVKSVQSVTSVIEHFSEVSIRGMLLSLSGLLDTSRFQRFCVSVLSLRPRCLCARTFSAQCFVSFVCFCSNPFRFPGHGKDLHQANKDNEDLCLPLPFKPGPSDCLASSGSSRRPFRSSDAELKRFSQIPLFVSLVCFCSNPLFPANCIKPAFLGGMRP